MENARVNCSPSSPRRRRARRAEALSALAGHGHRPLESATEYRNTVVRGGDLADTLMDALAASNQHTP